MDNSSFSEYFESPVTEITIDGYDRAYTVEQNGLTVRELTFGIGAKKPLTLALFTDSHIYADERVLSAFYNTVSAAEKADLMVLLGDNIESSSKRENVEILKTAVLDKYSNAICVIGNHEKFYGDTQSNRAYVDSFWPHNTYYHSVVVENELMLVAMDNNEYYFTADQCDKLSADIENARKAGIPMLVLTHIRFDCLDRQNEINDRMYKILTTAGDVIIAMFSGHSHCDEFHEYFGDYIAADGTAAKRKFPAYNINACDSLDSNGNILFVKFK